MSLSEALVRLSQVLSIHRATLEEHEQGDPSLLSTPISPSSWTETSRDLVLPGLAILILLYVVNALTLVAVSAAGGNKHSSSKQSGKPLDQQQSSSRQPIISTPIDGSPGSWKQLPSQRKKRQAHPAGAAATCCGCGHRDRGQKSWNHHETNQSMIVVMGDCDTQSNTDPCLSSEADDLEQQPAAEETEKIILASNHTPSSVLCQEKTMILDIVDYTAAAGIEACCGPLYKMEQNFV